MTQNLWKVIEIMSLAELLPLVLLVILSTSVWWLLCLIQAVKVPDSSWAAADQSKILYVLLMVFLGLIGTIIYATVARPALRHAGAAL